MLTRLVQTVQYNKTASSLDRLENFCSLRRSHRDLLDHLFSELPFHSRFSDIEPVFGFNFSSRTIYMDRNFQDRMWTPPPRRVSRKYAER